MQKIILLIGLIFQLSLGNLTTLKTVAQFVDCKGSSLTVTALDLTPLQCPTTTSTCKMIITGKSLLAFSVKQAVIDVQQAGVSMFKQTVAFVSSCASAGTCTMSNDVSMPVKIPSGSYTTKIILQSDKDNNCVCFTHDITI